MRYFFSAGEASGDLHAAGVIHYLRRLDPEAEITFLGGDAMASEVGHAPLIHYCDMAFMGFIDVARHLPQVLGNLKKAKEALRRERPDVLVLVDYPGFNFKLGEYARGLGIPVHYYIAPKLWAWKDYRLKSMRRWVDRVYSILPFEPEWFGARGLKVEYVGNPSVEEVDHTLAALGDGVSFRRDHSLDPARPILALVPGSRVSEIRTNLPVMDAVARRHPEMQAVVAGAPAIDEDFYRRFTDFPVAQASTLSLMAHSHAALVTSGTASLEAALAGAPQVVCYRAVGWKWAHDLFTHILKVPYCSLPNLITGPIARSDRGEANRQARATGARGWIIPEVLVHNCTPEIVDRHLSPLLGDTPERSAQLRGYQVLRERLATALPAAENVAMQIYDSVKPKVK